jgi:hypothetical protein
MPANPPAAPTPAVTAPDQTETAAPETTTDLQDPGFEEASPEADAEGGETSELPDDDEAEVTQVVRDYIGGLNRHDGAAVCALLRPGAIRQVDLPEERGGCARSLDASIGHRRPGGQPAWKRTEIFEVTAVSVGDDEARVTASVTHRFSDRKYTSIEEDVVYLDRGAGGRWLLAKPSITLYRAVGYPEPPLRALSPP